MRAWTRNAGSGFDGGSRGLSTTTRSGTGVGRHAARGARADRSGALDGDAQLAPVDVSGVAPAVVRHRRRECLARHVRLVGADRFEQLVVATDGQGNAVLDVQ